MTGALQLANKTPNPAGDDSFFGDADVSGSFCVKGAQNASSPTGITLIEQKEEWGSESKNYAQISYDGTNVNISKPITGSINISSTTDTTLQQPLQNIMMKRYTKTSFANDMNDYLTQGMYVWDSTTLNAPINKSWGNVLVLCNTEKGVYQEYIGAWVHQIAFTTSTVDCYIRSKINTEG